MGDAHPGATDQLLLHQLGVQGTADLIGRVDLDDLHLAGFIIHLDVDDQRGMGKA